MRMALQRSGVMRDDGIGFLAQSRVRKANDCSLRRSK